MYHGNLDTARMTTLCMAEASLTRAKERDLDCTVWIKAGDTLQSKLLSHMRANPHETTSSLICCSIWDMFSDDLDRLCDNAERKSLAIAKKKKLRPKGRPDLSYGMTVEDGELWFYYATVTERPSE